MSQQQPSATASIEIDAPAEAVWATITDVTRTPEWSPVCHRCEWLDGAEGPEVGARFRGHNRLNGARWWRDCEVIEAQPGKTFAFSTFFKGDESTRWRYIIEPSGTGSRLTESFQSVLIPPWLRLLRRLPGVSAKGDRDAAWNLRTSLERIKALAERAGSPD